MTRFAQQVLHWAKHKGRHDLPWQRLRQPYPIWVSEIMLQQTQVETVIPYFQRFIQRFPTILSLANATEDEVLHLWSGLGYYARARNLHRAARQIRDHDSGKFPKSLPAVEALPGIGPSTAGAILALWQNQPHPILDGNVKRVLTRYYAVEGYPGRPAISRRLWRLAKRNTPAQHARAYTQAIMDLGALLCTRTRPNCGNCPVRTNCKARRTDRVAAFPFPKPKRERPLKQTFMLMIVDSSNCVLLIKRPPHGVWGGLWSFPEFSSIENAITESEQQWGVKIAIDSQWPEIRHAFTHFEFGITPLAARVERLIEGVMDAERQVWYKLDAPDSRGIAAPVQHLLTRLNQLQ